MEQPSLKRNHSRTETGASPTTLTKKMKTEQSPSPSSVSDDSPLSSLSLTDTVTGLTAQLPSLDVLPHIETDVKFLQYQNRSMYVALQSKNRFIESLRLELEQSNNRLRRAELRVASVIECWDTINTDARLLIGRVNPALAQHTATDIHTDSDSDSDAVLTFLKSSVSDSMVEDDDSDSDTNSDDSDWQQTIAKRRSQTQSLFAAVIANLPHSSTAPNTDTQTLIDSLQLQNRHCRSHLSSLQAQISLLRQQLHDQQQSMIDKEMRVQRALKKAERLAYDASVKEKLVMVKEEQIKSDSAASNSGSASPIDTTNVSSSAASSPVPKPAVAAEFVNISQSQLLEQESQLCALRAEHELIQQKLNARNEELKSLRSERDRLQSSLTALQITGIDDASITDTKIYKILLNDNNKNLKEIDMLHVTIEMLHRENHELRALNAKDRENYQSQVERVTKSLNDRFSETQQQLIKSKALIEKLKPEQRSVTSGVNSDSQSQLIQSLRSELTQYRDSLLAYQQIIDVSQRKFLHSERHWFLTFHEKQKLWKSLEKHLLSLLTPEQRNAIVSDRSVDSVDGILNAALRKSFELDDSDSAMLASELDDLAQSHGELNDKLSESLLNRADLQEQIRALNQKFLTFMTNDSLIKAEILSLKRNIALYTDELASTKKLNEELSLNNKSLEDAGRGKELSLANLAQSVKELTKLNGENTKQIVGLKEESSSVSKSLATNRDLLAEQQAKYSELEGKYNNAKLKWNEFKTNNERLQHLLQAAQSQTKNSAAVPASVSGSASASSSASGSDSEYIKDLKTELEWVKKKLKCTLCSARDRDGIIVKCGHLFCHQCIEEHYESRNRKCPTCKEPFGKSDFKRVY